MSCRNHLDASGAMNAEKYVSSWLHDMILTQTILHLQSHHANNQLEDRLRNSLLVDHDELNR